jgi:hypothetical protein
LPRGSPIGARGKNARTLRVRVPELFALRDKREHARVNRTLAAMFRERGARRTRIRLHEGSFTSHYLADEDIWLVAHSLPNRFRNAFGPGDPVGQRNLWPSVQLNLALSPGSARPHARFLRDARERIWIAHTGALGGRMPGISREGFLRVLGGGERVRIDGDEDTLFVLGTFEEPAVLLASIAKLAHTASAYRDALAAGALL